MNKKVNLVFLTLFSTFFCIAQMQSYTYKSKIKGLEWEWNRIELPDYIYSKTNTNLSDIRIFGITKTDTVEAPYVLEQVINKRTVNRIKFKLINQVKNSRGYYYTFELPNQKTINQIQLEFNNNNFDWLAKLEGSNNNSNWFTVTDNYRILAIKNETTSYKFTKINIKNTNYKFFRLFVNSKQNPKFDYAKINNIEREESSKRNYLIEQQNISTSKKEKQTTVNFTLKNYVPINTIKLTITNKFDFYRPFILKCVTDSFKTDKGWKYHYKTITSSTLSSIEDNEFELPTTFAKQFQLIIDNHDNQPIKIDRIEVYGYIHQLITRIPKPANYYLVFGNKNSYQPNYDLSAFLNKIPHNLPAVNIGEPIKINKPTIPTTSPIFQNQNWLWAIMVLIIVILGWFSINMMRKT